MYEFEDSYAGIGASNHAIERFQKRMWLYSGNLYSKDTSKKIIQILVLEVWGNGAKGNTVGRIFSKDRLWCFPYKIDEGGIYVITSKIQCSFKGFSFKHGTDSEIKTVNLCLRQERDMILELRWNSLGSNDSFCFSPPVALRELKYALGSFNIKFSPEKLWREVFPGSWLIIPAVVPRHFYENSVEIIREDKDEIAVVSVFPTGDNNNAVAVLSSMGGQFRSFQNFIKSFAEKIKQREKHKSKNKKKRKQTNIEVDVK